MNSKLQYPNLGFSTAVEERVDFLMEEMLIPNNLTDDSELTGITYATSLERARRDKMIAGLAIMAASPLFAVAALGIWAEDQGDILYHAERLSGGKIMRVPKFRSMHQQKCNQQAPTWKKASSDDDRVTRTGRILRATSIDEWPQLISIYRGDMAIVGSRGFTRQEHNNQEYRDINGNDEANKYLDTIRSNHLLGGTNLALITGNRSISNPSDVAWWTASDIVQNAFCNPELDKFIISKTPQHLLCEISTDPFDNSRSNDTFVDTARPEA